jgi:hypothetical protein
MTAEPSTERAPSDEPLTWRSKARATRPISERFWAKVCKTDGCWTWTASTNRYGYGKIGSGGRYGGWVQAHRLSFEMAFGRIPAGMCVLHRCDNPPCVRPDHLFLGSPADNIHDMIAKGRRPMRRVAGERNGRARLTAQIVHEIRDSDVPARELAQRFGVTPAAVRHVRTGRNWKTA